MFQKLITWIAAGETPRSDLRIYMRVKSQFDGVISGPSGKRYFRGIDLHHAGIGAKVWRPLKPGSVVFIQLDTFHSMGYAYVRHCTWRGLGGYHIGLEFRSPLMRQDVGCWQFKHIQEAAGSPAKWDALVGKL